MPKRVSYNLSMKMSKRISHGILYVFLIVVSYFILFPLFWMISASFKPDAEIFLFPIQWIPSTFFPYNYIRAWNVMNYFLLLRNTAFITFMVVFLQLFTSTLAGYAFSKINFPERNALFLAYLATLMIPFQVVMIPQFIIVRNLQLMNTPWAVILVQAFSPFGVFMMRQFFLNIPFDLSEAARIDGLSEFGIYARIILPLSKPALAALAIFTSVNTWNDFLAPLIFLHSPANHTIQLGLRNMFSEFTADFGGVMAAATLSVLPMLIVFIILQRFFVEGIAMSGIKG